MAFILQQGNRKKKQAKQFILFVLSRYNAKSIFSKQSVAHAIPVVQLCKSDAIIEQLPMSTIPT